MQTAMQRSPSNVCSAVLHTHCYWTNELFSYQGRFHPVLSGVKMTVMERTGFKCPLNCCNLIELLQCVNIRISHLKTPQLHFWHSSRPFFMTHSQWLTCWVHYMWLHIDYKFSCSTYQTHMQWTSLHSRNSSSPESTSTQACYSWSITALIIVMISTLN